MKRKTLLTSALILGISSSVLAGPVGAATVDEVMQKYEEASKNAKEFSATMDMNAQLALSTSSETSGTSTISMGATGSFDIGYKLDPVTMGMEGSLKVDALGVGQNMEMKMYMVPSNDQWETYVYADDGNGGEWDYETVDASDITELTDMMQNMDISLSDFPGTFTLGDQTIDVNGISCYQLLSTMTWSDLQPIITEAMEAAGTSMNDDDSAAIMDALFSGIVFDIEIDLDETTYLPTRLYLNLGNSDLSALSELLGYYMAADNSGSSAALPNVSLDVNALYVEAYYDYTTPVNIQVPEEALIAKTTDNDPNVSSIGDSAENFLDQLEDAESENEED